MGKVLVLDVVGLTPSLLEHAPRLKELGPPAPLTPPVPAVTSTCQATMITGTLPRKHGIVANGWYFRDLNEIWFWRQSNRLIRARRIWEDVDARTAVLFWWFNMATTAGITITPRPAYPADGRKLPDVYTTPPSLGRELQHKLGEFPLFHFWGPRAGIESTRWIADSAIEVLERFNPQLCLVYLPHLDYDLQRYGPRDARIPAEVEAVDREAGRILDAAEGYEVLVVSEYGITEVRGAVHLNRILREKGFLEVQQNATGELLDPFRSRAFAVCDHQLAHVYVKEPEDIAPVRNLLGFVDGVDQVINVEKAGLDHERSGELVALSTKDRWFAYPYWLDEAKAPDFARTVDIHRKPGYDPCELFLDPKISKLGLAKLLLKKNLGLRTVFSVVPFDTSLVKGSHGRLPDDPKEGPLMIGDGDRPRPMTEVHDAIQRKLAT